MDEYTKMINLYYDEKIKSKLCNECSTKKIFTEKNKELVFSCGDDTDSKCGEQFKINLPEYIFKDYELKKLIKKLYNGLDNNGLNNKILHNFDIIDNVKENDEFVKEIHNGIKILNEDYEKNFYTENRILIKKYYNKRENLSEELSEIMYNIKNTDDETLKKELRNKYSNILKEMEELKINILPILNDKYLSLTYKEGTVDIIDDNFMDNIKKSKAKNVSKKISDTSVTINDFKEGMNVEWNVNKKVYKGIVNKINKRKKNKIEVMLDDGTTKEVNITKLKILD